MLTQATISTNPSRVDVKAALLCLLAFPQFEDKENGCVTSQAIPWQAQSYSLPGSYGV